MKRILLTLTFLFTLFFGSRGDAGGSNTVLIILDPDYYRLTFIENDDPNLGKELQLSLKQANAKVFLVSVEADAYEQIESHLFQGDRVLVALPKQGIFKFSYYCPQGELIIGTGKDRKVLLLHSRSGESDDLDGDVMEHGSVAGTMHSCEHAR